MPNSWDHEDDYLDDKDYEDRNFWLALWTVVGMNIWLWGALAFSCVMRSS